MVDGPTQSRAACAAVCALPNARFAAAKGCLLTLYADDATPLHTATSPHPDDAIHGLMPLDDAIVAHGVRSLLVLSTEHATLRLIHSMLLECRILATHAHRVVDDDATTLLVAGCDDNSVRSWHMDGMGRARPVHRVACSVRSVLYAMALRPPRLFASDDRRLLAASGSAFRTIWLWDASAPLAGASQPRDDDYRLAVRSSHVRPPLLRLEGHEGSIFALSWSPQGDLLSSVSDDRRAMIWRPDTPRQEDAYESALPAKSRSLTIGPVAAWFAHSSRVWACAWVWQKGSSALLTTGGEDNRARVWRLHSIDDELASELEQTLEFQGRSVWCVDGTLAPPRVIAGCGDGSVRTWPTTPPPSEQGLLPVLLPEVAQGGQGFDCPLPADYDAEADHIKVVQLISPFEALAATRGGRVWLFSLGSGATLLHEDTTQCWLALTLLDSTERLIAITSKLGVLRVLARKANALTVRAHLRATTMVTGWSTGPHRFAVVTSAADGDISVWQLHRCAHGELTVYEQLTKLRPFPPAQRTSALAGSVGFLLCGGSLGSIALICVSQARMRERDEDALSPSPDGFVEDAHGGTRVTDLLLGQPPREEADVDVYTSGLNGSVAHFVIERQDGRALSLRLVRRFGSLPGNSLERLIPLGEGEFAIVGFARQELFLWRLPAGKLGWRYEGMHRRAPFDLLWSEDAAAQIGYKLTLVHVSSRSLHVRRAVAGTAEYASRELEDGSHARAISALVPVLRESGFFFATGGDDNVVRVWRLSSSPRVTMEHVTTLSGQDSAITSLATSKSAVTMDDGCGLSETLLFSAGAGARVMCWGLGSACEPQPRLVASHGPPKLVGKNRADRPPADVMSTVRLVSSAAALLPRGQQGTLLASSTSHGEIRLMRVPLAVGGAPSREGLEALAHWSAPSGVALCMHLAAIRPTNPEDCEELLLLTGDSGGSLTVWDMCAATSVSAGWDPNSPSLAVPSLHIMGINALCRVESIECARNRLVVVSAGDDEALCVSVLEVSRTDGSSLRASLVRLWRQEHAHTSAIRTVFSWQGLVASSGFDQLVHLWKVDAAAVEAGSGTGLDEVEHLTHPPSALPADTIITLLGSRHVAVQLVSALAIMPDRALRTCHVVCAGHGLEVVSFDGSI